MNDTQPADAAAESEHEASVEPRRNFFTALIATLIGLVLAVFPFFAGCGVLLAPILGRRKEAQGELLFVTTWDALPTDGSHKFFQVTADRTDAWNYYPNQPVGSVFIRRASQPEEPRQAQCLSAICPHVGCMVSKDPAGAGFECPCHASSFKADGEAILPTPSPRGLDELEIDTERLQKSGEVWVKYVRFKTGVPNKVPVG